MNKNFFDKYGNKLNTGDILYFDLGSMYRVIEREGNLCIKCISKKLPLFVLDKIVYNGILVSAHKKM